MKGKIWSAYAHNNLTDYYRVTVWWYMSCFSIFTNFGLLIFIILNTGMMLFKPDAFYSIHNNFYLSDFLLSMMPVWPLWQAGRSWGYYLMP